MNCRLLLIISFLLALSCDKGVPPVEETEGTMTDIEGNVYKTVRIGNQWWMAENLRTTKYNDGTPITHLTDDYNWSQNTQGAFCFYNNTIDSDSIKKFGAIYNWHAINTKKLAPKGWHVTTNEEWDFIQNYLIANGYNWDGTLDSNKIAKSMAIRSDWSISNALGAIGNDLIKNNSSGFSAFPGGIRINDGRFYNCGNSCSWWTSTEIGRLNAYYSFLMYDRRDLIRSNTSMLRTGKSVRCVKD